MWQSKNLITEDEVPRPAVLSHRDLAKLGVEAISPLLLGEGEGRAFFAFDLPSDDAAIPEKLSTFGRFQDLRRVGALLDQRSSALLAYARALSYWHGRNRFCGDCGSPTMSAEAGHMRVCISEACKQQRFPRTDPAIIVLISSGEHCLLGRQPVWPERMYSVIAGFVEPGESLEIAVAREVHEETGVRVGEIRYHSSQPWPFPCSIMLGFTAQAVTRDILLGDDELEDARWFSRKELKEAIEHGAMKLPTKISIAYRLIEDWYDSGGNGSLRNIVDH
jgi:NAD+ diphosphatase